MSGQERQGVRFTPHPYPCKVQLCGGKAWLSGERIKTGSASIWEEEEPGTLPEKEEPRSRGEQGPRNGSVIPSGSEREPTSSGGAPSHTCPWQRGTGSRACSSLPSCLVHPSQK